MIRIMPPPTSQDVNYMYVNPDTYSNKFIHESNIWATCD